MNWSNVVLIPVLVFVIVRRFRILRRRAMEEQPVLWPAYTGPAFWMESSFVDFLRHMRSSVAAAVLAEVGVAAQAGRSSVSAALLFGMATAVVAWRWPMANRAVRRSGWSVGAVLAAIILLVTASWVATSGVGESHAKSQRSSGALAKAASRTGADLSGVILTLPAKPEEKVLPSPPIKQGGSAALATQPVRIRFDGVYWYFQAPDRRPRRDAKVVQGDPARARIRSTDGIPLQMEAHQRLPEHISFDPYREIVMKMRDADNVPGVIRVSLLLEGKQGTEPMLLGTRVLEASRTQHGYESRPAVEEELRFAVLPAARGRDWVAIVVRIEPERGRALAGVHVSVKDFLLEP